MNDDDTYDEFNYLPDDLDIDDDNYNQEEKKENQIENSINEEYNDFDDVPEIQENYDDVIYQDHKKTNRSNTENIALNNLKSSNVTKRKVDVETNVDYMENNDDLDSYLDKIKEKNNINDESVMKDSNKELVRVNTGLANKIKIPTEDSKKINSIESHDLSSTINNQPTYTTPSIATINKNISKLSQIKGNNNANILSKMQNAENQYRELKEKLDKLTENQSISSENSQSVDLLAKENLKLIKYLEKISEILDIVVDSSKIPTKQKARSSSYASTLKPPYSKSKHANNNLSINTVNTNANNKLIEVYKKEYEKLQKRFKQVSDPIYSENLEKTLGELDAQLNYYELENKGLKSKQKQSEFLFERQFKINNTALSNNLDEEIKKINQDYESIKKLNDTTYEKAQKNLSTIKENEEKIKTLAEHNTKLQIIAKEMYNIDNFENYLEEEKNEQKINEKRQNLKKKLEVLEKVSSNNKKKYEAEIARNDKSILSMERNKLELMKILKEKSGLAFRTAGFVKGIIEQNDATSYLDLELIEAEIKAQEILEKILRNKETTNEQDAIHIDKDEVDVNNGKNNSNTNSEELNLHKNDPNDIDSLQIKNSYAISKNKIELPQDTDIINKSIQENKNLIEIEKKTNEINNSILSANNNQVDKTAELVDDSKYIGKNNKPNFKFNFSQKTQNITPIITKNEMTLPKPTTITDKDSYLNMVEVSNKDIMTDSIHNKQNKEIKTEDKIASNIISKSITDTSNAKETAFTSNSRRINEPKIINKQKDNSFVNNNTSAIAEKQAEVPSFLKDFKVKDSNREYIDHENSEINNRSILSHVSHKKSSDNLVNLSNNNDVSTILNELPQRRNRNLTINNERKSIFEEALQGGFHEEIKENLAKIQPRAFLKNERAEDVYYKKRKEEFDSLFKDEEPEIKKKIELKTSSNKLIFGKNKDNINSEVLVTSNKNIDDSFKVVKKNKAYSNILDELEEIDLI